MSKVARRIEQPENYLCPVILLSEEEKALYSGAGWKIARFEDGKLAGFFDPRQLTNVQDDLEAANAVLYATLEWLEEVHGETWLVMCSAYELCDPTPVSPLDAMGIARVGRVFAQQLLSDRE